MTLFPSNSPVSNANNENSGDFLLDTSRWGIAWDGTSEFPFDSSSSGTIPENQSIITCLKDCSVGDVFALFYTATVPFCRSSKFWDVRYLLRFDAGLASASLSSVVFFRNYEIFR